MSHRVLIASRAGETAASLAESVRSSFPQTAVDSAPLTSGLEKPLPRDDYDSIICRADAPTDLEWVRRVRKSGSVVPILLVSGEESAAFRAEAMDSGATSFIPAARGFSAIFEHLALVEKLTVARTAQKAEMARAQRVCGEIGELLATNRALRAQARSSIRGRLPRDSSDEDFFARVLRHAPIIVYVYDLVDGRTLYANFHVGRVLGYGPDEIARFGSSLFRELLHPDDLAARPGHARKFRSLGEGRSLEIEYRVRTSSGGWTWLHGTEAVLARDADGSPRRVLGFAVDITARKRAQGHAQGQAETLRHTLRRMSEEASIEGALGHVLQAMSEVLGASTAGVYLLDKDPDAAITRFVKGDGKAVAGGPGEERFGNDEGPVQIDLASHPDATEETRAWARREGYTTLLAVPVRVDGKVLGKLIFRFRDGRSFDAEQLELARGLSNPAALVLCLARSAEIKGAATLVKERERMAAEMHDTVAQGLIGVILRIDMGLARMSNATPEARASFELAATAARETLAQARRAVWDLRSEASDDRDLVRALGRLAREAPADGGARVDVEIDGLIPALPYEVASNLFMIAREAVANALCHGKAGVIRVGLYLKSSGLLLGVLDDGCGFEVLPKALRRGFGLGFLEQRAKSLGAHLSIVSRPGEGTQIAVWLPLPLPAP